MPRVDYQARRSLRQQLQSIRGLRVFWNCDGVLSSRLLEELHSSRLDCRAIGKMPYKTEGATGDVPFTSLVPHLLGKKGPSGYGSNSTAEQVSKDWDGEGKVGHVVILASGKDGVDAHVCLLGLTCLL